MAYANSLPNKNKETVYLISAQAPGCGSTTCATMLKEKLLERADNNEIYFISVDEERGKATPKVQKLDEYYYSRSKNYPYAIIEGVLATTLGPRFLHGDSREIVSINLHAPILTSALRIMQREGLSLPELIQKPDKIIEFIKQTATKASMWENLRSKSAKEGDSIDQPIKSFTLNTRLFSPREVIGEVLNEKKWDSSVPDWEIESLNEALSQFYSISRTLESNNLVHPLDKEHFHFLHNRLEYQIHILQQNDNRFGRQTVREDIKNILVNCVNSLVMKTMPRFFVDSQEQIAIDRISRQWTPSYYKIANAWPTLEHLFKDQNVLDPFAGAGTFMNLLASRAIPKQVTYGDLCYIGGQTLNGSGYHYKPDLNTLMNRIAFDMVPSWYKPDLGGHRFRGYTTLDGKRLPFPTNAFDYVTGDPPYGKNMSEGNLGLFLEMLPELQRVASKGGVFMVPIDWSNKLRSENVKVEELTPDLSGGVSRLPVQFIYIPKIPKDSLHLA